MVTPISIGGRLIGEGSPCWILAEAGVNHNGDLSLAKKLVDAAIESGADAIKFQTFSAEALADVSAPQAEYQEKSTGKKQSQLELLKALELSETAFQELSDYAMRQGICFLSTPFDPKSFQQVVQMGVSAIKIGSGDLTNSILLKLAGESRLPVLLSTGMASLGEIESAMSVLRSAGASSIGLFHCVSRYPTPPEAANLLAMDLLATAFRVPIGFSDHTLGIQVAVAAVARGAAMIEKHLTLDSKMEGPDHAASLNPSEFKKMVQAIREVEKALGNGRKEPGREELEVAQVARKSLFLEYGVEVGTVLEARHLLAKRPQGGISPMRLSSVIGYRVRKLPKPGEFLDWVHLEKRS